MSLSAPVNPAPAEQTSCGGNCLQDRSAGCTNCQPPLISNLLPHLSCQWRQAIAAASRRVTGWIVAYGREEDWTVRGVSALFSDEAMTGKGYGLRRCADSIGEEWGRRSFVTWSGSLLRFGMA